MKKPTAKQAYQMLAMGGFINEEAKSVELLKEDLKEKERLEAEAKKQKNAAITKTALQAAGTIASVIPGGQIVGAGLMAASSLSPLLFKSGGTIEELEPGQAEFESEMLDILDTLEYKNGGFHVKDKQAFNRLAKYKGLSEIGMMNYVMQNKNALAKYAAGGNINDATGGQKPNQVSVNGGLTEFKGNTHELGGVKINSSSEVEDGETMWDDFVFTNAHVLTAKAAKLAGIPDKYVGKTFAEVSKGFAKNLKERENDPIEKGAFDGMMKRLREAHLIDVPQSRPKPEAQQQMVDQAQEQMTPEQMAEQTPEATMRDGGKMKYRDGGADEQIEEPGAFLKKEPNPFVSAPGMLNIPAMAAELIVNPTEKPENKYVDFTEMADNAEAAKNPKPEKKEPKAPVLRDNALQYAPLASSVADVIAAAKNKPQFLSSSDYAVKPDVDLPEVDRNLLKRQVDRQVSTGAYRASQVSANPADYLAAVQAISTGATAGMTDAELKAQQIDLQSSGQEQQINKSLEQFNAQTRMKVDDTNIAERDAYFGQLMDSIAMLGQNTGELGRELWTKDQINVMLPYNTRGQYANAFMAPQSNRNTPSGKGQYAQIAQQLAQLEAAMASIKSLIGQ